MQKNIFYKDQHLKTEDLNSMLDKKAYDSNDNKGLSGMMVDSQISQNIINGLLSSTSGEFA